MCALDDCHGTGVDACRPVESIGALQLGASLSSYGSVGKAVIVWLGTDPLLPAITALEVLSSSS